MSLKEIMENIRKQDRIKALTDAFPDRFCGNPQCLEECARVYEIARKMNFPSSDDALRLIRECVKPSFGCRKLQAFSYPNTSNYPNKGKTIPGCIFGYTYGTHPDASDEELGAGGKKSGTAGRGDSDLTNVEENTSASRKKRKAPNPEKQKDYVPNQKNNVLIDSLGKKMQEYDNRIKKLQDEEIKLDNNFKQNKRNMSKAKITSKEKEIEDLQKKVISVQLEKYKHIAALLTADSSVTIKFKDRKNRLLKRNGIPDELKGKAKAYEALKEKAEFTASLLEKIISKDNLNQERMQVELIVLPDSDKRSRYGNGTIYSTTEASYKTFFHELGHMLEDKNPRVIKETKQFLEKRCRDETPEKLKTLTGKEYDDNEVTRKDNFKDPYCGKDYIDRRGKRVATEILSMGVQMLFTDPVGFAKDDREYFDFVVGVLGCGVSKHSKTKREVK